MASLKARDFILRTLQGRRLPCTNVLLAYQKHLRELAQFAEHPFATALLDLIGEKLVGYDTVPGARPPGAIQNLWLTEVGEAAASALEKD